VENAHPQLLADIREKKAIDDDLKARMNAVLKECKERFVQGAK
jgi:F0F1-type ATP synthase alpha subunit